MTSGRELLIAAMASASLTGTAVWAFKPAPASGPRSVQVDTVFAEKSRPQLENPSLGQKLTTKAVHPNQVRIAAAPSSAGRLAVAKYCAPALQPSAMKDSLIAPGGFKETGPKFQPPSILPDFGGKRAGARLSLYSTLGDGRRWSAEYSARGRVSWLSSGDTVLVRGDRLWIRLVRGAGRCAPAMGGSALTGLLVDGDHPFRGALLGGVATALGCIF